MKDERATSHSTSGDQFSCHLRRGNWTVLLCAARSVIKSFSLNLFFFHICSDMCFAIEELLRRERKSDSWKLFIRPIASLYSDETWFLTALKAQNRSQLFQMTEHSLRRLTQFDTGPASLSLSTSREMSLLFHSVFHFAHTYGSRDSLKRSAKGEIKFFLLFCEKQQQTSRNGTSTEATGN